MPATVDPYVESKIMTAPPHQLHLMVVDGAIRYTTAAEDALRCRDREKAHFAFDLARRHVAELISGLDAKKQPDVVRKLEALFLFAHRALVEADLRKDPSRIADALVVLRMHRETWLALGDKLRSESATMELSKSENGFSWSL